MPRYAWKAGVPAPSRATVAARRTPKQSAQAWHLLDVPVEPCSRSPSCRTSIAATRSSSCRACSSARSRRSTSWSRTSSSCSGDLTSNGFKDEYALAREYLDRIDCKSMVVIPGNHDSRNVGYVHFEELFGERNSVLRVGTASRSSRSTRPSPTSTTARSAAAATGWIEEEFAAPARPARVRPPPPPAAGARDRPRAQHRLRRRRRDRMPAARRASTSSSPGTSTSRMRGGSRTSSSSTPARSPRCGCAATRGPVTTSSRSTARTSTSGAATRSTGRSGSSSSTETKSTRSTRRGSSTRCARRESASPSLIDGEHYAPVVREALARAAVRLSSARSSSAGRRSSATERTTACRWSRRSTRSRRRSSSTSPTSRCSGRASGCCWASRALALGLPYVGADFRFDPPPLEPVGMPSIAVIGTGKRVGKTAVAGARRARARRATARRRRCDGARRAGRAGAARGAADARRPARALARRAPRGVRPSRDRRALAGVPTIGCRRAGGGLAGAPFLSNVARGRAARGASSRPICSSSTAAARRCRRSRPTRGSSSRTAPDDDPRAGLNAYRVLVSDLVVDIGGADREAIARSPTSRWSRRSCGCARRAARAAAAPPSSRPGRADRPPRRRGRPRLAQPRATATRCGAELETRRRRGLPRRAEGGRDRRRRRGTRSRAAPRSCSPATTSSRDRARRARCSRSRREAVRALNEPRRIMTRCRWAATSSGCRTRGG